MRTHRRPPYDAAAWDAHRDRVSEMHAALRAPRPEGGHGIAIAAISRGRHSSDLRVVFTARPTMPLVPALRLATASSRSGIAIIDLDAHHLEELRDAIDAAIRRRDAIVAELEALKPPRVAIDTEDAPALPEVADHGG